MENLSIEPIRLSHSKNQRRRLCLTTYCLEIPRYLVIVTAHLLQLTPTVFRVRFTLQFVLNVLPFYHILFTATKGYFTSSPQETEALNRMKEHELAIEAPLYQSYHVQMVNKMRANSSVLLGISGDKIEIDPLPSTSNIFWVLNIFTLHLHILRSVFHVFIFSATNKVCDL